jgi:AmmeMemoRadiSam system protein B
MSDGGPVREGAVDTDPFRPKLRPIETFTTLVGEQEQLVLRDPTGYVESPVSVSPAAGVLLRFFDGNRTPAQIVTRLKLEFGLDVATDVVQKFAAQLDEIGFLDSPVFEARRAWANAEYRRIGTRPARFAGESYPADPRELAEFLERSFDGVERPDLDRPPLGIVAPHIDLRVAGKTYAHAYRAFHGGRARPDLFLVLGTSHGWTSEVFVASSIPYDTPLGLVPNDAGFVGRLAELHPRDLFRDEAVQRIEHTIEFQALHLRYLFGDDVPPMVPVLCRSIELVAHDGDAAVRNDDVNTFVDAVRRTASEQGKRVCFVAGADLSHVGPRFDDPSALQDEDLAPLEAKDREVIGRLAAGDAAAFYQTVVGDGNARRICGLTPIFVTMRWTGGRPAVVSDYRQWLEGGSCVTFAAAEFRA